MSAKFIMMIIKSDTIDDGTAHKLLVLHEIK